MSFHIGYTDGTPQGRCVTLPDQFYRAVNEEDACQIAEGLRHQLGKEPSWQKVRGELIQLAHRRMGK